jgi:hypothetical protein
MKKKNPIHAYKRLLAKDHDWDYAFLIALEKKKLQRMHDCIKRESPMKHKDFVVRDIAICIRLIDIFMEEDAAYTTWLNQSFSGKVEERQIVDYPVYVNTRNEKRFFRCTPIKDDQLSGNRTRVLLTIPSLRQLKALHLYHLIREYKLLGWWY